MHTPAIHEQVLPLTLQLLLQQQQQHYNAALASSINASTKKA
jgi:hypothetical protein